MSIVTRVFLGLALGAGLLAPTGANSQVTPDSGHSILPTIKTNLAIEGVVVNDNAMAISRISVEYSGKVANFPANISYSVQRGSKVYFFGENNISNKLVVGIKTVDHPVIFLTSEVSVSGSIRYQLPNGTIKQTALSEIIMVPRDAKNLFGSYLVSTDRGFATMALQDAEFMPPKPWIFGTGRAIDGNMPVSLFRIEDDLTLKYLSKPLTNTK